MRFFFYGTLIDPDVRRLVLGGAQPVMLDPARLAGWERREVVGATFPIVIVRAAGIVEGVLARGIDEYGSRRLVAYEGDGYGLSEVEVILDDGRRKSALVFAPASGGPHRPGSGVWRYETWSRRHKAAFLREIARDRWGRNQRGRAAARLWLPGEGGTAKQPWRR